MIRAGRADLADFRAAHRGCEGDSVRSPVDFENDAVRVSEQRAAERGKDRVEEGWNLSLPALRDFRASEPEVFAARTIDRTCSTRNEIDRAPVALLTRVAPRHQTVFLEQHGAGARIGV